MIKFTPRVNTIVLNLLKPQKMVKRDDTTTDKAIS